MIRTFLILQNFHTQKLFISDSSATTIGLRAHHADFGDQEYQRQRALLPIVARVRIR